MKNPPSEKSLIIILGLFYALMFFCVVYIPEPIKRQHNVPERVNLAKLADTSEITVWVTYYQADLRQCNSIKGIGASGIRCETGTCAVTQPMLDWYVNYNDIIEVLSGVGRGKYRVTDKAAGKANLVDIYKPLDYKGKFCYKSKIKIKRHD